MPPLIINCTGTSTLTYPPELAILHLTISATGPSQPPVTQSVTQTSNSIASHLKTLTQEPSPSPSSPISHWTLSSLSTSSWQPAPPSPEIYTETSTGHTREKPTPPRVFTASVTMTATFQDFSALGTFSAEIASTPLVSLDRIEWNVRPSTRTDLQRRGRREAVRDAMAKAKDYADAVGKGDFEALEISDVGGGGGGGGGRMKMMRSFAREGGGEELSFRPEDVSVSCEVTVKFDAA